MGIQGLEFRDRDSREVSHRDSLGFRDTRYIRIRRFRAHTRSPWLHGTFQPALRVDDLRIA